MRCQGLYGNNLETLKGASKTIKLVALEALIKKQPLRGKVGRPTEGFTDRLLECLPTCLSKKDLMNSLMRKW